MKVILNDDILNLGGRGDVKTVADGYARNFLLPKGLAYEKTAANLARFREEQKQWDLRQLKQKQDAEAAARALDGISLTLARRAGEEGVLFGSVTSADIAEALAEKGIELDKRKIQLPEPIKRVGSSSVPIHFHRDVDVSIEVEVVPENPPAAAKAAADGAES